MTLLFRPDWTPISQGHYLHAISPELSHLIGLGAHSKPLSRVHFQERGSLRTLESSDSTASEWQRVLSPIWKSLNFSVEKDRSWSFKRLGTHKGYVCHSAHCQALLPVSRKVTQTGPPWEVQHSLNNFTRTVTVPFLTWKPSTTDITNGWIKIGTWRNLATVFAKGCL